ncbi:MAG: thiamine diphosphokinase [Prevotella sp.]
MTVYPLISERSVFDAVILCDGDFPRHLIPRGILARAAFLCCCDDAGRRAMDEGLTPDVIVGDCDTMSPEFYDRHRSIICRMDEQDDNDQTKATRYCISRGFKHIAYLGATGRREDHTLANISLLSRYMREMRLSPVMITDHGCFVPASGHSAFATFARQQVSIFNVSCTTLSGKGLRWQPYTYSALWQGTLNEATGDMVDLDGDGDYLVYLTHNAK